MNAADEAGFQLLLTTDRRIRYQQNLRGRHEAKEDEPNFRESEPVLPSDSGLRRSLRSVQNSQSDYLPVPHLIDCDERERRERDLSRTLHATKPPEVRGSLSNVLMRSTTNCATVSRTQDGVRQCRRRSVPDRPRHPSSTGRASAVIAPIDPSGDIIAVD